MKNILLAILFSFALPPQGIYTISVKKIDGGVMDLSRFHGKKMVFFILSGKEPASRLDSLAAFCSAHKDAAAYIGIPSVEDGFNESGKAEFRNFLKSHAPDLILTEGMYTRKASAAQSTIMQWFTHSDQNHHFGNDITGPGWKFFVDEAGELYGALSPSTQLTSPVIQRILNKAPKPVPSSAIPQKNP